MNLDLKALILGAVLVSSGILSGSFAASGQNKYVGTASCAACHPQEKKAYDTNAHSKATGGLETEDGIGCEACHGPGQTHVAIGAAKLTGLKKEKGDLKILGSSNNQNMEMCKTCHTKTDNNSIMLAANDLIVDLQEYSELTHSVKAKFKVTCTMCHDAHINIKEKGGIKRTCLVCHTGKFKVEINIKPMAAAGISCENCHMPYAVRKNSDTMVKGYHKGDTLSHIFGISVDPKYTLNDGTKHASITKDGLARLTVEMTCYACHKTGVGPDMPREELLKNAAKIH